MGSGEDAVAYLSSCDPPDLPDVLLLDSHLGVGRMSGFQVSHHHAAPSLFSSYLFPDRRRSEAGHRRAYHSSF